MHTESLVAEFVERVRDQARSQDPEEIRRSLKRELCRARESFKRDPIRWSAWGDGIDVPGEAYESLVSGADRRRAGQFQTPAWAADLMAGWLLQMPSTLLLDPGVGAGRLIFRAVQRPEPGPSRILGLDIDPVSLEMARVNLMLREIDNADLRNSDFLLDDFRERPTTLICNPPYSRHHAISGEQKDAIHAGFEQRLGLRLSRLAGLHALFLVRALECIAERGRLAFITPAEWLDVNYGRAIKEFVLARAHIEALVLFEHDHLLFGGALTTAAITLLRADGKSQEPTRVIRLPRSLPSVEEVLAALRGIATNLPVDSVQLTADMKWSRPAPRRRSRGKRLADFARIRRGIATGCNRFFVLSEGQRSKRCIDHSDVLPCLTTPRVVEGDEISMRDLANLSPEIPRWVLECRDTEAEFGDDALGRYLRWGRRVHGAHAGYLASRRKPWYSLERRHSSPILFTYMNRQRPRFIRNRAGAVPLNTFLIVEPHKGVGDDDLWQALCTNHVQRQLVAAGRNYGGGLWKLEPAELSEIRISM